MRADGTRVKTRAEWAAQRAPMISLLEHYQYGHTPLGPFAVSANCSADTGLVNKTSGLTYGTLRACTVRAGPSAARSWPFQLKVYMPLGEGPLPAFVSINAWNIQVQTAVHCLPCLRMLIEARAVGSPLLDRWTVVSHPHTLTPAHPHTCTPPPPRTLCPLPPQAHVPAPPPARVPRSRARPPHAAPRRQNLGMELAGAPLGHSDLYPQGDTTGGYDWRIRLGDTTGARSLYGPGVARAR